MSFEHGGSSSIKLVHVVAGLDQRHGGPSYSVPRIARAQSDRGAEVSLITVSSAGEKTSERQVDGYYEYKGHWWGERVPLIGDLRISLEFDRALFKAAQHAEVIHGHGLWLWPNISCGRIAERSRKPLILSPRGMLAAEALSFSRQRKRLMWYLLQGPALQGLSCIHVTSVQEYEEVRAFGLANPVALVPNGIDIPDITDDFVPFPKRKREVLYLGRLHPKKSLDMLIAAWSKIASQRRCGWRLRIVGPSENGYGESLLALASKLGIGSEVSIEPPIFGEAKFLAFRQADLFVLPTRNENFGLTVAEALSAGTPVVSTRGAPWAGLEVERCGWWPAYGVDPLVTALDVAMSLTDSERQEMGRRGREWISRDFSWDVAAERLLEVANWLHNGCMHKKPVAIID